MGLWVGRKKTVRRLLPRRKKTRWWGVAGSIFGSSVSANHIVGMMGVGFAVGFAQSHLGNYCDCRFAHALLLFSSGLP